ncbi:unnamed protein product [Boreogadus saida]
MMLRLQRYNLDVICKRGRELYVADALSRAHLPSTDQAEEMEEYEVMVVDVLSSHRVEELKRETLADPLCRRLAEGTHLLLRQLHIHEAHNMTVWDQNCHRDSGL